MRILMYIQLFNQECEGWSGSQRGVALGFRQHFQYIKHFMCLEYL